MGVALGVALEAAATNTNLLLGTFVLAQITSGAVSAHSLNQQHYETALYACEQNRALTAESDQLDLCIQSQLATKEDIDKLKNLTNVWASEPQTQMSFAAQLKLQFLNSFTVFLFFLGLITVLLFFAVSKKSDRLKKLFKNIDRIEEAAG
jgi:hypothetical protein